MQQSSVCWAAGEAEDGGRVEADRGEWDGDRRGSPKVVQGRVWEGICESELGALRRRT